FRLDFRINSKYFNFSNLIFKEIPNLRIFRGRSVNKFKILESRFSETSTSSKLSNSNLIEVGNSQQVCDIPSCNDLTYLSFPDCTLGAALCRTRCMNWWLVSSKKMFSLCFSGVT
ncbi:unnamed protein product, partial [Ixodes persulcatus]